MYMQQYKNWLALGKNLFIGTTNFASMHYKCRSGSYPRTEDKVKRYQVCDDRVEWTEPYLEYIPVEYTAPHILAGPYYADPLIVAKGFSPKWNSIDGKVDRRSHEGDYAVIEGVPRNIHGRTGVTGRGALGRWGPNHAADPIVTRWKEESGQQVLHEETKCPILQFVCIQRRDNGQWAIPGGMVDPGEKVTTALQREFLEEALNSMDMTPGQKERAKEEVKDLFKGGEEVYRGYVDDPRNTDNAWMETVAYNFHENKFDGVLYRIPLQAGDDAQAVKWQDISGRLDLYASHREFIHKVARKHNAHW